MSILDNKNKFEKFIKFRINEAFTYGNTNPGQKDCEKRERIRRVANQNWPNEIPPDKQWGFKLFVEKSGNKAFDIENVPKLFIDAFSKTLIDRDNSQYTHLKLYQDDTIDYVTVLEIQGQRGASNYIEVTIYVSK